MVLKHLLGLAFLATLLFAACGEDGDGGTDGASDGRNGTPTISAPSATPTPDETLPAVAAAARRELAARFEIAPEDIEVVAVTPAEWPDSCLGAGGQDEVCAEVITPGYEVVLQLSETQYTYRTDQTGTNVRFGGVHISDGD